MHPFLELKENASKMLALDKLSGTDVSDSDLTKQNMGLMKLQIIESHKLISSLILSGEELYNLNHDLLKSNETLETELSETNTEHSKFLTELSVSHASLSKMCQIASRESKKK